MMTNTMRRDEQQPWFVEVRWLPRGPAANLDIAPSLFPFPPTENLPIVPRVNHVTERRRDKSGRKWSPIHHFFLDRLYLYIPTNFQWSRIWIITSDSRRKLEEEEFWNADFSKSVHIYYNAVMCTSFSLHSRETIFIYMERMFNIPFYNFGIQDWNRNRSWEICLALRKKGGLLSPEWMNELAFVWLLKNRSTVYYK